MSVAHDLRIAARQLRERPGFTALAVATLALGIGASTAMFSAVEAALWRPLPYADADRLVLAGEHNGRMAEDDGLWTAYPNFIDLRSVRELASLDAFSRGGVVWQAPQGAVQLRTAVVSGGFFDTLGVRPQLGRLLTPADDAPGANVAVATFDFFRTRMNGDPAAVGRTLTFDDQPWTIVGVLPPAFHFSPAAGAELFQPLPGGPDRRERRNLRWLLLLGRLAGQTSFAQAQAAFDARVKALAQEHPAQMPHADGRMQPLREALTGNVRGALLLLLAAVFALLLIGCANVANLVLVRAASRRKEIAVRAALGATRGRLIRQLLTESLLLATLGGLCGVVAARWMLDGLVAAVPDELRGAVPWLQTAGLHGTALCFALLTTLGTGVLFGLLPALSASRGDLQRAIAEESHGSAGPRRQRLRKTLAAGEIALAVVLAFGAGLVSRSLAEVLSVNPGFEMRNLLVAQVMLSQKYEDPAIVAGEERLLAAAAALPGVKSAAAVNILPLDGSGNTIRFRLPEEPIDPSREREGNIRSASAGYFATLGTPLVAGREFDGRDRPGGAPVAVVSRALADRVFAGNAVGRQLVFTYKAGLPPITIVGVAEDVKMGGLDSPTSPVVYLPTAQDPSNSFAIVVRAPDGVVTADQLRRALVAAEPGLVLGKIERARDLVARSGWLFARVWPAALASLFAGAALLLALLGVYGVMAVSVSQRTREIGIRMALGAAARDVRRLVLAESSRVAAVGIGCGLLGALAVSRLLRGLLFGVSAADPLTLGATCLLLALATLLAGWLPARRASRVSPVEALRD